MSDPSTPDSDLRHLPPPQGPPVVVPVAWRRLHPLMLVVHPVQELGRFLPLVVASLVFGSSGGGGPWDYLGVVIPVVLGLVRYLTTRYRITGTQIELHRGLLSRAVLTAPLDRIRTVELTAPPVHRLLGLSRVQVGTGSRGRGDDDKGLVLDALATPEARALRDDLLPRSHATDGAAEPAGPAGPAAVPDGEVLLRLDWRWLRYAPLGSSGVVAAGGLLAVLGQFNVQLEQAAEDSSVVRTLGSLSPGVLVPLTLVVVLLVVSVLSVVGYAVTNGGFTLTRTTDPDTLHVRRGLVTTTEASLDRDRLRGVTAHEPLGLRLAGARRLAAVLTGAGRRGEVSILSPAAPLAVVERLAAGVLDDDRPLQGPLRPHGPVARRRRWTRAGWGFGLPAAALVVGALAADTPAALVVPALVLLLGVWVARDRYRRLGHALVGDHLVVRSGTFAGRRTALRRDGVIGWNLRQSFFQRRAGIVTLVATTSAGTGGYAALDLTEATAVALAHETTPGLLDPFLT